MTSNLADTDTDTDDEFYDSLDRILSSSNSSASASDNDDDRRPTLRLRLRSRRRHLDSLHLWTSEPASIADRRRRLLHLLGLSADPSLSRDDVAVEDGGGEDGRNPDTYAGSAIGRFSFSDDVSVGAVERRQLSASYAEVAMGRFGFGDDITIDGGERGKLAAPFDGVSTGRFGLVGDVINSGDGITVTVGDVENRQLSVSSASMKRFGDDMSVAGDDIRILKNSAAQFHGLQQGPNCLPVKMSPAGNEGALEVEKGVECLFKNLDNGKEFVLKESGEDGVPNKVRDLETGRQLTIEEFEMCVGRSPIVQELMQRQNVQSKMSGLELGRDTMAKRKGVWLRNIKNVVGAMMNHYCRDKKGDDEKDALLEKGGPRLSSATDDSQDCSRGLHYVNSKKVKVRLHGKSQKELTCLVKNQEIQAHEGSIWSMKFSLDGGYLASAGVDRVIHVWEVINSDHGRNLQNQKTIEENASCNGSAFAGDNNLREPTSALSTTEENMERQRSKRLHGSRKNFNSELLMVPDHVFALSEKPTCSFRGHLDDILDLSWSKSLHLLSSSMDKTVRLWHLSSKTCLKIFSHSDCVTCIQFNPVDDRFFISGSLDEKIRIWSIPDRQIVDWIDLHEMVTAVCYTPDGQSALVGSHKGNCHFYDTSENKLLQKSQVELGNKKKKSRHKKITGFQFSPGSSTKVLITSADSRIRVVDGDVLVQKFKGFRNTSSQISAHLTRNEKYIICSSEDDSIYLWRYEDNPQSSRSKGVPSITKSYEHFHCDGVTLAIPWSGCPVENLMRTFFNAPNGLDDESQSHSLSLSKTIVQQIPPPAYKSIDCQQHNRVFSPKTPNSNHFNDRVSATWPEELMTTNKQIARPTADPLAEGMAAPSSSAWGLVIVTAGRCGQIRIFQNYGLPVGM